MSSAPPSSSPNLVTTTEDLTRMDYMNKAMASLWHAELFDKVKLPTILVAGDQSVGKSSLLEAISDLKFPVSDIVCTKFATVVVMVPDETISDSVDGDAMEVDNSGALQAGRCAKLLTARISPSEDRTTTEKAKLRQWTRTSNDFADFGKIVADAGVALGISESTYFVKDKLMVRVLGSRELCSSFIDLPGLILTTTAGQADSNVERVQQLVSEYMANERTIIVAVVTSALNFEVQQVLRLVKEHDPSGRRTIGVITKPDKCADMPNFRNFLIQLLKGDRSIGIRYDLGWHVVRNRSGASEELRWNLDERSVREKDFFSTEPWNSVPENSKGSKALWARLYNAILPMFLSTLPALTLEVEVAVNAYETEFKQLSDRRPGAAKPGEYLTHIMTKVTSMVMDDLKGATQWGHFRHSNHELWSELKDLAKKLELDLRSRANKYEFDRATMLPNQLRLLDDAVNEIERSRSQNTVDHEPTSALLAQAELMLLSTRRRVGLSDDECEQKIVLDLFNLQASGWPGVISDYAATAIDILRRSLASAGGRVIPSEQLGPILDTVVAAVLRDVTQDLISEMLPMIRPRFAAPNDVESVAHKAIEQQCRDTVREWLRLGQHAKDDGSVNVCGFFARQHVAWMQVTYHNSIDDVSKAWNVTKLAAKFQDVLQDLPSKATQFLTTKNIEKIFGDLEEEQKKMARLQSRISCAKRALENLNRLSDLT